MTYYYVTDTYESAYIERFANAANGMTKHEIEMCVIQAEAVVAAKSCS
nr:hypothetical protein [Sinorhizobium sp. A49]